MLRFSKISKKNIFKITVVFLTIWLILVIALIAINHNKIIIGVKAGNIYLSGKNKDQAREILTAEITEFYGQKITIAYNNLEWEIFPEDLGINFDTSRSLEKYWNIGRERKNIFSNINRQIKGVFRKYDFISEDQLCFRILFQVLFYLIIIFFVYFIRSVIPSFIKYF